MSLSRALSVAWVLLSLACGGAVACDKDTPADGARDVVHDAPPPAHDAPSLDEVRAAHDFAVEDEGAVCSDDRSCESPLRCTDSACFWPPALIGEVGETTPTVTFHARGRAQTTYYLEVVSESWERSRGLMDRRSLVEDMGMIFVFEDDTRRTFWMRNTYIPLDMVFVTIDGAVDSFVENATPLTDDTRASDGPARYVVELNAGEVARMGLRPGDNAEFAGLGPEFASGAE